MKNFHITVNGNAYDVQVDEVAAGAVSPAPVLSAPVKAPAPAPAAPAPAPVAAAPAGAETINAPMPGTIMNVLVSTGDTIARGQVLLILEAMKMENEIMSPCDGVIAGVHVNKGDSVDSGKLLISIQ